MSPRELLAQELIEQAAQDQNPEFKAVEQNGFSKYSILSQSMNNPAMITAMRKKVQEITAKMTSDPLTEDQPLQ